MQQGFLRQRGVAFAHLSVGWAVRLLCNKVQSGEKFMLLWESSVV
ncbi:hypothetical protein SAMN04488037_1068 [Shimia marina]|uniref:Uncharacterized protein n=1 Tax=Shimia marina TaxID=321267 RepID=A0A0P1EUE9_9RHOB|nr:hypothetical protein SHM7688_03503 [Shimia marina]SFE16301.1 hypothetical protein SAMN04488037_1068 [Shimia marina]